MAHISHSPDRLHSQMITALHCRNILPSCKPRPSKWSFVCRGFCSDFVWCVVCVCGVCVCVCGMCVWCVYVWCVCMCGVCVCVVCVYGVCVWCVCVCGVCVCMVCVWCVCMCGCFTRSPFLTACLPYASDLSAHEPNTLSILKSRSFPPSPIPLTFRSFPRRLIKQFCLAWCSKVVRTAQSI